MEEKGSFLPQQLTNKTSELFSESHDDADGDENECENYDMERFEIRANSVIEIILKDNVIALYSPPESLELSYLCKVIAVGVATKHIVDKGNHCIKSASHYIKCQYFEKIKERKLMIKYKLLPDIVLVLPTQVMNLAMRNVLYSFMLMFYIVLKLKNIFLDIFIGV